MDAFSRRGLLSAFAIAPVAIAAPAGAMPAPSHIEALRLEYRAVFNALNASPEWDDDCPIVAGQCNRMSDLEGLIVKTPCRGKADAKAKLRFACDLFGDGMILDGDDAAELMKDVARHLL